MATIALVDDDRDILASIRVALETEGFAARAYAEAEPALSAIFDRPPELAVLDIKTPRMDGMELLRRLRRMTAARSISASTPSRHSPPMSRTRSRTRSPRCARRSKPSGSRARPGSAPP